jgi:hypothetical protein
MTWWHRHYGMIDFGGMDGGVLVQAAWGVSTGNIPYHDIPNPMPPLFFIGAGWAFRLLGPTWSSLEWLVCGYAMLTFAWSFLLLARITLRPWHALAFAVVLQAVTLLSVSWWWYNPITTLAGVIALLSGYGLSRAPRDRVLAVSLGFSIALLLLAKLNTAMFLCGAIGLFLILKRETRLTALACLAGAGLGDLLFLALQHISVPDYIQLGRQFSGRLFSTAWTRFCLIGALPSEHWVSLKMFCFFTLACLALIRFRRQAGRGLENVAWTLIAAGVTYLQMATNNDFKIGDLAYILALLAVLSGTREGSPFVLVPVLVCAAFPTLLGLKLGEARSCVVGIGPLFYAGAGAPDRVLQQPPLFRGLATEHLLADVLDKINAVIVQARREGVPANKIFFGPRVDFGYAAYGLPYPTGLPIWWEKIPSSHRGEQYPAGLSLPPWWGDPSRWLPENGPYDPRVQRFIDDRFRICIFLRGYNHIADMGFFPPNLRGYIYEHYRRVDYPDIVVFLAK